jgi:phage-related protein
MAEGAESYLKRSPYYADSGLTPYEMILAINLYFEINSYSPKSPECQPQPTAQISSGGQTEGEEAGCSAIALLPKATKKRKVIHISSKDQSFWPQCYGVSYTMEYIGRRGPSGRAYKLFKAGTAGELAGMNVVNAKGVTITGHAGGRVGIGVDPLYPDYTFGIPAQFGIAQAGFFSKNLKEAIENLVQGSDYYRQNMGRKTVQWARSFNMSLSDTHSAAVVEENPYRYGVRYPGDMGEFQKGYIVMTNHNSCRNSYDGETDQLTDIPMTRFGDGYSQTSVSGLDGSGTRFWTLMWLAKNNFGKIDEDWAMREFWTRDYYYWEDGYKDTNVANATTVANKAGRNSGQVNTQCSVPSEGKNYWTVGTPPDWVGPWDSLVINEKD